MHSIQIRENFEEIITVWKNVRMLSVDMRISAEMIFQFSLCFFSPDSVNVQLLSTLKAN